jgi:hypothetical protein
MNYLTPVGQEVGQVSLSVFDSPHHSALCSKGTKPKKQGGARYRFANGWNYDKVLINITLLQLSQWYPFLRFLCCFAVRLASLFIFCFSVSSFTRQSPNSMPVPNVFRIFPESRMQAANHSGRAWNM